MERRFDTARFSAMSLEAKVAVVLFFAVGVVGIGLGMRGVLFRLNRAALVQLGNPVSPSLTLQAQESAEREAQKTRDTDKDGLTDYDELYVYRTSAYLTDTDSDGMDDATELRQGKDPACPEGRNCLGALASAEETGSPTTVVAPPNFALDFGVLEEANGVEKLLPQIKTATVAELRAYLLSTGVDATIVNKLSDEQVRSLFEEALADVEKSGAFSEMSARLTERAQESSQEGEL